MRYTINDLIYGGKYTDQFWNKSYNPNADIENGLANCTTFVIGACLVEGDPYPVSYIAPASRWDEVLINDWYSVPFDANKVKSGDIIEWKDKCHVAKVSDVRDGVIYVNASYYTGEHGVAYYHGSYDTRSFKTLKEMSAWMVANYPERFYHNWSLEKESRMVGGSPDKILVRPQTVKTVEIDPTKNQVETTDNTLRIRNEPSLSGTIVGHVSLGYYNVLSIKEALPEDKEKDDIKCWYEIAKDRWIANITTIYHEASGEDVLKELEKYFNALKRSIDTLSNENANLKADMKKVNEITRRWV